MAQDDYKSRDTELILPPGVFAFVLDETKGHINTLCGPIKQSLSNTDRLVTYNSEDKRFQPTQRQYDAIQTNVIVPKGSYVVLENPSVNGKQPEPGKAEVMPIGTLRMGQIENLPGPQSFPLWPGQVATVVKGHHLRSNQYLLVRVYDDEAAKSNWDKSVVKVATTESEATEATQPTESNNVLGINKDALVTGQIIVIKGTVVAFYIPPTGIEVLVDETSKYVRDAVTLERLDYSILLGENGNKEYKIGPAVVFPTPTQTFFTKNGNRKFRAYELQPTNGIHVKVIADYEEGGKQFKAGDEIFITGKDMPIYYPREEHAIITYGGKEITFSVAIPSGEGRYVLDRQTGEINLVNGPAMFLPNPTTEVIVTRILSDGECELYYPGNSKVLEINRQRRGDVANSDEYETLGAVAVASAPDLTESRMTTRSALAASHVAAPREVAAKGTFADALTRGTKYTSPRSISLPTKYDGAVRIDVWSGFAVQVVNSKGDRRTVIGPSTVLLQYDEYLERLSLSKGKPKNSDNRMNTAYLRYISNPVSDIISLKTQDLVNVDIQVKYLVRFEESEKDRWFSVDNYVQYMVDHLRSMIGNAVRNIGVQEFYTNATNILRDVVLGVKTADGRSLKHFDENGMTVYDLELITITVKDQGVADQLSRARQEMLTDAITLDRANAKLELTKGIEAANRQTMEEQENTARLRSQHEADAAQRKALARMEDAKAESEILLLYETRKQDAAVISTATQALYLEAKVAEAAHAAQVADADLKRKIALLVEEAKASETRMKAVQPALVEAIVALAQTGQLDAIAEHLAPLSIVRGESLAGTVQQLFHGTPLEGMVSNIEGLSKVKKLVTR